MTKLFKVCGRIIRVDHVEQYKIPKDPDKLDEDALRILQEGCGPESSVLKTLVNPPKAREGVSVSEVKTVNTEHYKSRERDRKNYRK